LNNYYTLLYLNKELNKSILSAEFEFALSPHKNVLECYFAITNGLRKRIIFNVYSTGIALFLDDYRPPKRQNVYEFFQPLEGCKIESISLANYDRLLTIVFEGNLQLLFKLFGNNANALLIKDGVIIDAFKQPEKMKGENPPEPQTPHFADDISSNTKPKKQMTQLNPLLPRNLLPPLINQHRVEDMNTGEVKAFTNIITEALLHDSHPRVLKTGDLCLWSETLLNLPTKKSFKNVNDAIRFAYRNAVHLRRLHNKKEHLIKFLSQSVQKKEAEYDQLQQADKSLQRAKRYKKFGHLLMAHAHQAVKPKMEEIEVNDFYENNKRIAIPLKKGRSIAENAERYYDKAKSSRTSYEKATERAPKVKQEKEKARALLDELQQIGRLKELDKWTKSHIRQLEKYGYGAKEEGQAESPFRKFKVGKYEVWIGKNAKSNDKLTGRAHKEDIWLHARGVGGAHAVIRMGNEQSYPPKAVIQRAASYAAHYSKAKGMKMAPVSYTKRKYVYNPSGSAPGEVVLNREEVVMVAPAQPGAK
jgi:predicted ribosome quality control (RQC) complex YloA/Tae2 family protein